jgi:hypothetical protein
LRRFPTPWGEPKQFSGLDYARENGYGVEEEAVVKGMEEMSEKYKEMGNNLHLEDMENVVNPLAQLEP